MRSPTCTAPLAWSGWLGPAKALKREPNPGGQVKVQPSRSVVQVLTEQLPDSLQAVLQRASVYGEHRCRLVDIAATVKILRESCEKAGAMPLVVVEQRAELLLHKGFDSSGVSDRREHPIDAQGVEQQHRYGGLANGRRGQIGHELCLAVTSGDLPCVGVAR